MEYNQDILENLIMRVAFQDVERMDKVYSLCLEHYKNNSDVNISVISGIVDFLNIRLNELNKELESFNILKKILIKREYYSPIVGRIQVIKEMSSIDKIVRELRLELTWREWKYLEK